MTMIGISGTPPHRIRRLWDSSVIIGALSQDYEIALVCEEIIQQAQRGETEILVSQFAKAECAYLRMTPYEDAERMIAEFFARRYVVAVELDDRVATLARHLVRKYLNNPKLRPPDAVHLASAIVAGVPFLETKDPDLLRLDGMEGGATPITIRWPEN